MRSAPREGLCAGVIIIIYREIPVGEDVGREKKRILDAQVFTMIVRGRRYYIETWHTTISLSAEVCRSLAVLADGGKA